MNKRIIEITGIILLIWVAGCTSGAEKGNDRPEALPNLQSFQLNEIPELILSEDESFRIGSYSSINNIGDVAVDQLGRVYVVNNIKKNIHVYDPRGEQLTSIGNGGSDPGEFLNPGSLSVIGDSLYAFDLNLQRAYTFSLDTYELGQFINLSVAGSLGVDSLSRAQPEVKLVMNDGTYLIGYQTVDAPDDRELHFYRLNASGKVISDQVMSHSSKNLYVDDTMTNMVIMMLPYTRETLISPAPAKQIVTLYTEDFLIKIHDSTGVYQKAWRYPFENRLLNEADAVDRFTNVNERRAIRGADLPDTWPAVADLLIDKEGRIWVATIPDNLENHRWYMLNANGEPKGWFELPVQSEIKAVDGNDIYVKRFNSRRYSDEVIKYRVQMNAE